jgi:hypothetical protein
MNAMHRLPIILAAVLAAGCAQTGSSPAPPAIPARSAVANAAKYELWQFNGGSGTAHVHTKGTSDSCDGTMTWSVVKARFFVDNKTGKIDDTSGTRMLQLFGALTLQCVKAGSVTAYETEQYALQDGEVNPDKHTGVYTVNVAGVPADPEVATGWVQLTGSVCDATIETHPYHEINYAGPNTDVLITATTVTGVKSAFGC